MEPVSLPQAPAAALPLPEPPDTGPYRLQVGDELELSVYGIERSRRRIPIDPSGNITYMLIGTVRAAGMTIDDLRQALQAQLDKQYRFTILSIVPLSFSSQNYTVIGQVGSPGTYPMRGRTRLVAALCTAGGLRSGQYRNSTIDLFDLKHAILVRQGELVPVDFERLIEAGDASQNVYLEPGDLIHVPSSLRKNVYVLGEVRAPRALGFYGSVSLLSAIAETGGRLETAGNRALVIRGKLADPELYSIDLSEILNGKRTDILLAPDDIVYVPPRRLSLLRDMVQAAVRSFALTVTSDTASALYQQEVRPSDDGGEVRPLIIP